MSNNKRKMLIDTILTLQKMLVSESNWYSFSELKDVRDLTLLKIGYNLVELHLEDTLEHGINAEPMPNYKKRKKYLERLELFLS
jgi:hypothetical protein